jgi:hypothetical protein
VGPEWDLFLNLIQRHRDSPKGQSDSALGASEKRRQNVEFRPVEQGNVEIGLPWYGGKVVYRRFRALMTLDVEQTTSLRLVNVLSPYSFIAFQ